jgi:hypothetical protein
VEADNGLGYDSSIYCSWGGLGNWGSAQASIEFFDASTNWLGWDWLIYNQQGDGGWTQFTKHFASLPAGTTQACIWLRHDGGGWYADFDTVTWTATPLPPAIGQVELPGYQGVPQDVTVKVDLDNGSTTQTVRLPLDAAYKFTVPSLAAGTYRVVVSGDCFLAAVRDTVVVAGNPGNLGTYTLRGGDSNGDNAVTFEDFSVLQNSYGISGAAASPAAGVSALASGTCGGLGFMLVSLLALGFPGLGGRSGD